MVIGQFMPVANPDPSITLKTHVFKEDKAFLYVPIITKQQGCMAVSQIVSSHYLSRRYQ